MIIGRLLIAALMFVGLALSVNAKMPGDVTCPSKTYLRSCPIDAMAAAAPASSSERPCPGKAILASLTPERTANSISMRYQHAPVADLKGAVSGGIERPPKFSRS